MLHENKWNFVLVHVTYIAVQEIYVGLCIHNNGLLHMIWISGYFALVDTHGQVPGLPT